MTGVPPTEQSAVDNLALAVGHIEEQAAFRPKGWRETGGFRVGFGAYKQPVAFREGHHTACLTLHSPGYGGVQSHDVRAASDTVGEQ